MPMITLARHSTRRRQSGLTLVEILITVFVLAIGLLGTAMLQFMSKRSNFEAVQRTTATLLAHDIIERMRANYQALDTYAGTLETQLASLGGGTMADEPTPTCTAADPCEETADIARHDLWEWERAIDGAAEVNEDVNTGGLLLPTACLYSLVSAAAEGRSGNYVVAIAWRGPTEMTDPANPISPPPDPDPYTCGQGSGKYDGADGPTTAADTHRRVLVVETYINATNN